MLNFKGFSVKVASLSVAIDNLVKPVAISSREYRKGPHSVASLQIQQVAEISLNFIYATQKIPGTPVIFVCPISCFLTCSSAEVEFLQYIKF